MTDIIFSFDTEDFTCSRAADGILEAAETLRAEGIRGCFCMVGLLAEQLLAWGRTDVLEALKYHEVHFHSFGHSFHPCMPPRQTLLLSPPGSLSRILTTPSHIADQNLKGVPSQNNHY